MTVAPIAGIGAVGGVGGVDPSTAANLTSQLAGGMTTDPTAATSTIGSDLSTSVGSDLSIDPTSAVGKAAAVRSSDFGSMIGNGLTKVESLDTTAQTDAISAATGNLTNVHDYVIAAQEAQTAVELTTTLRNKALDSFNQIMGMSL